MRIAVVVGVGGCHGGGTENTRRATNVHSHGYGLLIYPLAKLTSSLADKYEVPNKSTPMRGLTTRRSRESTLGTLPLGRRTAKPRRHNEEAGPTQPISMRVMLMFNHSGSGFSSVLCCLLIRL